MIILSYPKLEISLSKIKHNTEKIVGLCIKKGISIAGVTKAFCGIEEIAKAMVDGGVDILADSRIKNLKKLKDINVPKLLLRLPMISNAKEVVEYTDISLNSELKTIEALSKYALEKGKIHKIILMIDIGDLREGIFIEENIFTMIKIVLNLTGVKLIGIGTNLSCFGGVVPSNKNLGKLVTLKKEIEKRFNIKLDIISGGNSTSFNLVMNNKIPKEINHLRLGTMLLLGHDEVNDKWIEDTYNDCFRLITEIIEIKEKPSIPIGEIGNDAFGNKPVFEDRGIRKRAICAIGKQDIDLDWMKSEDNNILILGASSDHLILDITDCKVNYEVGNKISFILDYVSILKAMNSDYVEKILLDNYVLEALKEGVLCTT